MIHDEIRMTKDMKFLLFQLIGFDGTPERLASILHLSLIHISEPTRPHYIY